MSKNSMARMTRRGESDLRSIMAEAVGQTHVSFERLEDARRESDSALVLEGDYGDTIYLTVPVRHIACDEPALIQLLRDIDSIAWQDSDGTTLCYELLPVGARVAGGMGGGMVVDGLWLHSTIEAVGLRSEIESVLAGVTPRIEPRDRRWK